MSKSESRKWLAVAGRALLGCTLLFSQSVRAGQHSRIQDKASSPQKVGAQLKSEEQSPLAANTQNKQAIGEESENATAEEKSSGNSRREGIKVHGHWTIEVRNSDGTVVAHREFENSYVTSCNPASACNVLTTILAKQITAGPWVLDLGGTNSPCGSGDCEMREGYPSTPGSNPQGATIQPNNGQFVLNGTFQGVPQSGSINSVSTSLDYCPSSVATTACTGAAITGIAFFTSVVASSTNSNFPAPIPVQAGQTIAVTVTISFS